MKTLTFSHSSHETYKNCRKKYLLYKGLGLLPKYTPSPMIRGSVFHWGVKALHRTGNLDKALKTILWAIGDKNKRFGITETQDFKEKAEVLSLVQIIITGYYRRYIEGGDKFKFKELEKKRKIVINGNEINFIIDGIGTYNGNEVVLEQKTTSQIDENFAKRLRIDVQTNSYIWMLQQAKEAIPTHRMMRLTKIHSFRMGKETKNKPAETVEDFQQRVIQDYIDNPEKYFMELIFPTDSQQVKLAGEEFLRCCEEIRSLIEGCLCCTYHGESYGTCVYDCPVWYRDTAMCSARGTCQYFNICCGDSGGFTKTEGFII